MYLKRFGFPSYGDERGYLINCSMGRGAPLPFGVFPQRSLSHIDMSNVTVFCGSSDSEKDLALEVIAAKLGVKEIDEALNASLVRGYLSMCFTRYAEYIEKRSDVEKIYLSREGALEHLNKNKYRFDGRETLLHFYESQIKSKTICLLQEPETYMSFEETVALACLIEDFAKYSKTQFIISTNSLPILGIKDALIYDFDESTVMGKTWYNSSKAIKYIDFYRELIEKHSM